MINHSSTQIKDFQIKSNNYEIFDAVTEIELQRSFRRINIILLLTAVILIASGFFLVLNAQPKHIPKKTVKPHLEPISLVIGQPTAWVNNENFVYDGFYVQTVSDRVLIKFPVNMGNKIRAAVRIGVIVNVSGVITTNLIGDKEMKLVKLNTDKEAIYTNKTNPKQSKAKQTIVKSEGKITQIQIDKEGKINGYILENKLILRVPITVGEQLRNIVIEGSTISYTGVNRVIAEGEVSSKLYDVVICKTITVNGNEFLVKQ